ncbi:replication initiator protein A [Acutalibacter muris]|uniref:Replication initiator protein A n=1 Tax=Acutalibacter muris TaxID=1796620 RepID=A0A1Z2XP36_9FIRM|nr:DUF6017 domain-containing protein [Acutalibacter muris]ANU53121.1 hypothetical protein A4V00_03260 [Hungateiclostridiaceae bacterium KB18]ASB40203.1 hypothetical protein ADH66_05745 [Acutalibacter muris]QQR29488.1 replication initiator protein A [Acutalibacter muris]
MKKLQLKDLHPETARGFRFLMVPSELIENGEYADLDDSAKLLYSKMIERAGWSACNEEKFSDKSGRLFIIYTVEQMKKDLQKSQPTIVKLTKQLEDKGLIEKVRQGQGKPTRIYIKDFSSAPHHEPEKPGSKDRELSEVKNLNFRGSGDLTPEGKDSGKSDDFTSINEDPEPSEVKDVNFLKLNSLTSRSKDSLLPEVKNLNSIYTENIKTENNNLPSNPPAANPEGGVDGIMENVREQIEYDVLAQEYGQELCDEVVEIITEVRCRDSPRMKIGTAWYPMDFVRQRMESLTSDHVSYVLDSLGRAGPVRNPHGYLLALLFNAPASSNTAVQALYNAYNG